MAISPRENMMRALNHEIPEYIPNYRLHVMGYIPSCVHERAPGDGSPQQALGGTGKDWFGVEWIFDPPTGGSMVSPYVEPILKNVADWRETVVFPDLDAIDWEAARAQDAKFTDNDKFKVITLLNGPYERLHSLMGMAEANCAIAMNPEAVGDLLMAIADHKIRLVDKVVEYYPVDMIELHDDWGHQRNTFMSPKAWDRLIAPAMEKIVAHIKSRGKMAQVHSCGRVEKLIPRMIEIGIDHWSSCQTCNDIDGIVARYGDRLTCLGGMDTPELTDPTISREELKERVSRRIDAMCRGCGLLVYGSRSYPVLVEVVNEVIEEKKDFFKDPQNRVLPTQ